MEDTPARILRTVYRLVASWLAAGLVMVVLLFAGREGHAHVPLSMFPEWLLLTPVAPLAAPAMLAAEGTRGRAAAALVLGVTTFAWVWRALRTRGSK